MQICSPPFSYVTGRQLWTSGAMEAEHRCDAQRLTSVVSRLNDVPTASRMKLTRPCPGGGGRLWVPGWLWPFPKSYLVWIVCLRLGYG